MRSDDDHHQPHRPSSAIVNPSGADVDLPRQPDGRRPSPSLSPTLAAVMDLNIPPSYEEATTRDPWALIAGYIDSADLCAASLVSRRWHELFAPCLWGSPASHFGTENDRVYVALTRFRRILPVARADVRRLTHTLHFPPALSEIYDGPRSEWLRDVLERLPRLQSLVVSQLPFFDHAALLYLQYNSKYHGSPELNPSTDFPIFPLRLLIATKCANTTPAGLSEAFLHWQSLVFLDLSDTPAARHRSVLATFRFMTGLQVLKLRHVGLRDAELEVLADAVQTRVRSLDVRDNRLTDAGVRTLLACCFHATRDVHSAQARGELAYSIYVDNDERWSPSAVAPPLSPHVLNQFRSDDMDDRFVSRLTQALAGRRLAADDLPRVGLTHLYLANNPITVGALVGLLRTQNLHVLDAAAVLEENRNADRFSLVNGRGPGNNLVNPLNPLGPGAERITPVLEKTAAKNLTYLRVHHSVVSAPAGGAGRVGTLRVNAGRENDDCDDDDDDESPQFPELGGAEIQPELDSESTARHEAEGESTFRTELEAELPVYELSTEITTSPPTADPPHFPHHLPPPPFSFSTADDVSHEQRLSPGGGDEVQIVVSLAEGGPGRTMTANTTAWNGSSGNGGSDGLQAAQRTQSQVQPQPSSPPPPFTEHPEHLTSPRKQRPRLMVDSAVGSTTRVSQSFQPMPVGNEGGQQQQKQRQRQQQNRQPQAPEDYDEEDEPIILTATGLGNIAQAINGVSGPESTEQESQEEEERQAEQRRIRGRGISTPSSGKITPTSPFGVSLRDGSSTMLSPEERIAQIVETRRALRCLPYRAATLKNAGQLRLPQHQHQHPQLASEMETPTLSNPTRTIPPPPTVTTPTMTTTTTSAFPKTPVMTTPHRDPTRGLLPGRVPALRTLVLTDVPQFNAPKSVVDNIRAFIADCAYEQHLANLQAEMQQKVERNAVLRREQQRGRGTAAMQSRLAPDSGMSSLGADLVAGASGSSSSGGGSGRSASTRLLSRSPSPPMSSLSPRARKMQARELFGLERIVLEMAPANSTASTKISTMGMGSVRKKFELQQREQRSHALMNPNLSPIAAGQGPPAYRQSRTLSPASASSTVNSGTRSPNYQLHAPQQQQQQQSPFSSSSSLAPAPPASSRQRNHSSTEDEDTENLWNAAQNDFSFFDNDAEKNEECGLPGPPSPSLSSSMPPPPAYSSRSPSPSVIASNAAELPGATGTTGYGHRYGTYGTQGADQIVSPLSGTGTVGTGFGTFATVSALSSTGGNATLDPSGAYGRFFRTTTGTERKRNTGLWGASTTPMAGGGGGGGGGGVLGYAPNDGELEVEYEVVPDLVAELAAWRADRKRAFESAVRNASNGSTVASAATGSGLGKAGGTGGGGFDPARRDPVFIEGYWPGEVKVMRPSTTRRMGRAVSAEVTTSGFGGGGYGGDSADFYGSYRAGRAGGRGN